MIKGVVSDATSSFRILAGTVLKKSIPDLVELSTLDWSGETQEDKVKKLAQEVDCISQIYKHLMKMDSVGLPLQPAQICAGQPVMLVIGKVPLAEVRDQQGNGYFGAEVLFNLKTVHVLFKP
ncbi:hypothetical protein B0H13DRAFT_1908496 [Mycena leptocephala]|nr:hypothetical protein B0H13DRAFT_1908496 [Mycena leptocephala]